jgi:tetratricopeptide (TPR) repeat protein
MLKMANRYQQFTGFHLNITLILTVLLGACTANPVHSPAISALENQPEYDIPSIDPLRVSPEMQEFVRTYAIEDRGRNGKAWSLAYAALDPYLFDFDYDPQVTLPADEAFLARTGNCLTFSSLFVAMARSAGLEAWYQEIEIPPTWSNINDTLLVSMHVNAIVQGNGKRLTVDVSRRKQQQNDVARRLDDLEAEAQYYNNLGAEALIVSDLARAYAYFKKALSTEPDLAYVWSNLGVVYRRNEQTGDAITAYRFALQLDPDQTVALNNIFLIYEEDGELELAARLQKRVENNRRKNPYHLHYLAEVANEEQRYSDAIGLLNQAIRLDKNEYRFHYTLAQSQYYSGKTEDARASLDRARQLAPADLQDSPLTLPDQNL